MDLEPADCWRHSIAGKMGKVTFPPLRRALRQRKYDGLWAPTTFRDSSIVLDEHAGMYQVEWSTGEDPTGHVGGLYWFTYEDLRHSSMVRSRRTRL